MSIERYSVKVYQTVEFEINTDAPVGSKEDLWWQKQAAIKLALQQPKNFEADVKLIGKYKEVNDA
tara:strand:+ start:248 stop:442 length:195 start_codon:yes stop_codon:yes gene_type:complete